MQTVVINTGTTVSFKLVELLNDNWKVRSVTACIAYGETPYWFIVLEKE